MLFCLLLSKFVAYTGQVVSKSEYLTSRFFTRRNGGHVGVQNNTEKILFILLFCKS